MKSGTRSQTRIAHFPPKPHRMRQPLHHQDRYCDVTFQAVSSGLALRTGVDLELLASAWIWDVSVRRFEVMTRDFKIPEQLVAYFEQFARGIGDNLE